MSDTLIVSVVTPEGSAYEGEASKVIAPAFDGELAVYPLHAPLVAVLGYGELRVTRADGVTEYFYLAGGVLQVADNKVSILAEAVMPAAALNATEAQAALVEALSTPATGDTELSAREARSDDARARLRAASAAAGRGELTADQILDLPVE